MRYHPETGKAILLAQHLRKVRRAAKLTQRDLADELSCPRSLVSSVERSRENAAFHYVLDVLRVCAVDLHRFLAGFKGATVQRPS